EQLEHCRIARGLQRIGGLVEEALRRLDRQRLGERPCRLGRAYAEHGIGPQAAIAREPRIAAAPCRKRESKRGRRKAAGVERRGEATYLSGLQRFERRFPEELEQEGKRLTVVAQRRGRNAPPYAKGFQVL